ncbi:MAG TPA: hypothetical protein VIK97_18045 [Casimicrobiaceae bacterium]
MSGPSTSRIVLFRVIAALLFAAALWTRPAFAANYDYTDIWYTPVESGWGVNFAQADNFIFATFFFYGADKKPTWYTGQLTWDGTSTFTGGLYATQGTYFASPWNPADNPPATLVGTATFTPNPANNFQGTLVYTVNGVGTITKAIQRQTLTSIQLGGNYVGGETGGYSGCTSSGDNSTYLDSYTLIVAQSGTSVSMTFSYPATGTVTLTCALAGTLVQTGTIYGMTGASLRCSNNVNTTATVRNLKATPLGIEGQFSAPGVGGGCRQDAQFGATLQ